ncbi:glycosyl hydrolase [Saccharospirillum salsuginis]|uniref:glucan endo-1,3-beta-D-glucosidase n=1 Tax=Saccharospirillum salsuginis TaxID=418750 RepID=A0A918NE63_9GAMM|nr:glycosyl hydrolase [Saccharospirillum salsuginis]GGX65971.1 hypothetical protein GCM10007392_36990 [Saccharospirillum salsuginis]
MPTHARRAGVICLIAGLTTTLASAATVPVGQGSIADQPNPEGYTCSIDHGTWIHNAGVVEPAIDGCDEQNGPIGTPTRLYPHLTGPAADQPTGTHRWWGSVAFYGDMPIDDVSKAGYITPDPITARISDRGFRMLGIPGGIEYQNGNSYIYAVPDPFSEVFDGLAIANSQHSQLEASLYDYSDGSVTVEWQDAGTAVMRATFVHGSPYAFVDVLSGDLLLKSKAIEGPEKGIYHQSDNALGVWTDVAGNRNTYLIVGDGPTQFDNTDAQQTRVDNASGRFTIALLPVDEALPDTAMIDQFSAYALNRIDEVRIDYTVDDTTQDVTVQHRYLNQGAPVDTLAGLMPMHWKNAVTPLNSDYHVRSARGVIRFAELSDFQYQLPFVGVLPTLPASDSGSYDPDTLAQLIREFIDQGEANWNTKTDTYWSGKNYGKVAELAALAHSHGLTAEHQALINWLKAELENWFTAETNGEADTTKYFSYDDTWNTLLGYDESFGAQQQLNDHHFHYGYFVRAAAEICRVDKSWCADDAWGPMVDMLIRDYAADRDDPLFPYTRNFDPANGFSWASGHANFALGNNNESTSEAANAYGAIILYGLITGDEDLVDHGIYLHASSTAAYWEYWNNLDRYRGYTGMRDNFPAEYDKMTTSIIWGNGMVFSTWFSGAYAHILGIQGLPLNPLVMHIGQYPDYLEDYVDLGLSESGNGKPSGLPNDQWRDVWWNIWAMTNPEAAIADFNTMNFDYDVEAGETVAHTYHWIHSFNELGHLVSGKGEVTADHPAALVFEKNGQLTYLAYNYSNTPILVSFSDGMAIAVQPNSFGIKHTGDQPDDLEPDTEAPVLEGSISHDALGSTSASLSWPAASDNQGVSDYEVTVSFGPEPTIVTDAPAVNLTGLDPDTAYSVTVLARDAAGNESAVIATDFTTRPADADQPPSEPTGLDSTNITDTGATLTWSAASDDVGVSHYEVVLSESGSIVSVFNPEGTQQVLSGLSADTSYTVSVVAVDTLGQTSTAANLSFTTDSPVVSCTEFCLEEDGDALIVTAKTGDIVDLHFTVNQGAQQNVRMTPVGDDHQYTISNLAEGDVIDYFFTVIDGTAYDTAWDQHVFGGGAIDEPDNEAPTRPGAIKVSDLTHDSARLDWAASTDNVGVDHYEVTIPGRGNFLATSNSLTVDALTPETTYDASVVAVDAAGNVSSSGTTSFATPSEPEQPPCDDVCATEIDGSTLRISVQAGGIADLHYTVNDGGQLNVRMATVEGGHQYDITGLNAGDRVDFFVTVIDGTAYDTPWQEHVFNP